jgi:hypothetical protein
MAKKNTYQQMLYDLMTDLQEITVATIVQSGVKPQSKLAKSIGYVQTKDGVNMVSNYYYPFVSAGRRSGIKKVPISALIEYIKEYNIPTKNGQTINQLAFAIQTHIFKAGIKAKNFDDKVATAAGDIASVAVADDLAIIIANELVDMFAPVAI